MIEETVAVNDEGVMFLSKLRFIKPFDYENGVRVEKINGRLLRQVPGYKIMLNMLGLRKVGVDPYLDADTYALYPWGYIQYKAVQHILTGYWWLMRFLYNNARMFQQIPTGTCFSWRYFTPYVWINDLRKWISGNGIQ